MRKSNFRGELRLFKIFISNYAHSHCIVLHFTTYFQELREVKCLSLQQLLHDAAMMTNLQLQHKDELKLVFF